MDDASHSQPRRDTRSAGGSAWRLAALSLMVLALAAVLFGAAWAIGGDDAVSDNWVGMTVVLGLFVGVTGAFVALVMALYAGLRREPWGTLWFPLTTFPAVVTVIVLLEAFVFE